MQPFVVRTGEGGQATGTTSWINPMGQFTDSTCVVRRVPRQHKGWQSVSYKGKRYQLFGGFHVYWFICLNSPIEGK